MFPAWTEVIWRLSNVWDKIRWEKTHKSVIWYWNYYYIIDSLWHLLGQTWGKGPGWFTWPSWPRGTTRCIFILPLSVCCNTQKSPKLCDDVLLVYSLSGLSRGHRPTRSKRPRGTQGQQSGFRHKASSLRNAVKVYLGFCHPQGKQGLRGLPGPRGDLGLQVSFTMVCWYLKEEIEEEIKTFFRPLHLPQRLYVFRVMRDQSVQLDPLDSRWVDEPRDQLENTPAP